MVGIDAGSVSLNAIVINPAKEIIHVSPYRRHFGRVQEETYALLRELFETYGNPGIDSISFTGTHGNNLSKKLGVFYEFETISQVHGVVHLLPEVKTIISMGGQDSALFLIKHAVNGWELENFAVNGPCASGTGSFIDQQAERLATELYDRGQEISQGSIDRVLASFIQLGLTSKTPSDVACRCTVFTKSDMIHLQNKGEKLADIIFGLHIGNARNYISTLVSKTALESPIAFIGGLSLNALQIKALKSFYPNLLIPPHSTSTGALGVALKALSLQRRDSVNLDAIKGQQNFQPEVPRAPKLKIQKTIFPTLKNLRLRPVRGKVCSYLGVDIGSTTTKYALIDDHRRLIAKNYVPTRGKPIEVTQELLKHLRSELKSDAEILGVATTGSGRQVVGTFLNADLMTDEITAHARGAVEIEPDVDTILEIGGQDAKYISIVNSHPLDFDMNKVCAAGTGSFLHELAGKFGINIVEEFQNIAMSSTEPVKLAERCTVFMESDISSWYQKGVNRRDLVAGLCYAVVYNYLNRVVGRRKIGQHVMFLGGPSLNMAVVAAFENILHTGLIVPAHREVMGAFGAAVCVQEKMLRSPQKNGSQFRGLKSAIDDRLLHSEKICRAKANCQNQCKLKVYDFGGHKTIWGGDCGRYEMSRGSTMKAADGFALRRKLWEKHLKGICLVLQEGPIMEADGRPTVGMQSSMYGQQTGILWAHFFDHLGYRLVLTPPTSAQNSKAGISHAVEGACYPVKVSHGHVLALLDKTRFLFLPTLIDMPGPKRSDKGCYCPMIRSNSYTLRSALNIKQRTILAPVIHLKNDLPVLASEISRQIKSKLGVSSQRIMDALKYALKKHQEFIDENFRLGRKMLKNTKPDKPFIVVTGRPYNLYDARLNLSLGQNLAKIGISSMPMDFIDSRKLDLGRFSTIYWGLGAQILRTVKWIEHRSNCFGLHLTNFGCGVDSFIEHFYKYIMKDKAYLILELDEHSAVAGVMTRLEAYKNVIEQILADKSPYKQSGIKKVGAK